MIRWLARCLGLIGAAFNTLFVLVASQAAPSSSDVAIIFSLLGLAILGFVIAWFSEGVGDKIFWMTVRSENCFVIAWFSEGVGGAIMMAGAIGLGIGWVSAGAGASELFLVSPLFVAGTLFMICWWKTARQES